MVSLQHKLNLKVSQRQILTPGLMQMVSVLALNNLELKDMIQAEIAENPVLEELEESVPMIDHVAEPEQQVAATDPDKPDPFDEIDFGSYFQEYLDPGFRSPQSFEVNEKPSLESYLSKPDSLEDHLAWQIGSLSLSPAVRDAAEYIVGNLNEDGYLPLDDEELLDGYQAQIAMQLAAHPGAQREALLAEALAHAAETLALALSIVRGLDPVGIAARDLRECLMAQVQSARELCQQQLHRRERAQWEEHQQIEDRHPLEGIHRADAHVGGHGSHAGHESCVPRQGLQREHKQADVGQAIDRGEGLPARAAGVLNHRAGESLDVFAAESLNDDAIFPGGVAAKGYHEYQDGHADPRGPDRLDTSDFTLQASQAFQTAAASNGHGRLNGQPGYQAAAAHTQDHRDPLALHPEGAIFQIAERICDKHLQLLQKRDLREVAKAAGTTVEQAGLAFDFIRTLDPRPGQRFNRDDARLIEPDVIFVKRDDEYVAVMDDESVPSLRLNQGYRRLLKQASAEKDVKDYVKERYRSALQLMRNIEQRKNTILRTCEVIVRRQLDFLEYGVEALKPMMIKDVAEEIGVHPSTVSRAVSNKYVHTPQGVFELRFFFTEGVNGPEGSGTPLLLLKRKVKKLIEEEDPRKPLTDELITHLLQQQGIDVTRRTVAKYREDLRIPSTHQRRIRG
jgi:DNA-directed RNA polymerase specialized sigma54-like protein